MRSLRLFGFFLLSVIIVTGILSLLMPLKQSVERTVTIHAPAARVYEHLRKLKNFYTWSVWNRHDSSIKTTWAGTDGEQGASSTWKGNPELSGEGKITIRSLDPGKKIVYDIRFTNPRKRNAESVFTLEENNGNTTVHWKFDMATPRPWNIFNMFYSLDKNMGNDFGEGLSTLKTAIEGNAGTASARTFDVKQMNYPTTYYAIVRQQISFRDIPSFFGQHVPVIAGEMQKQGVTPGVISGLYFSWDEKEQQTDLAVALPVPDGTKSGNPIVGFIEIPGSKAKYINYTGAYDHMVDAHNSLDKYLLSHNLEKKNPAIEQYIAGPANEPDTSKWVTNIVCLVK
jgi:effector-binding domain-containing protein/uncharacterized protein YndB with AHSA1/START domain